MHRMRLVWVLTVWILWSCWLIAQYVRAPSLITRAAAGLLVAELLALAVRSFGCGTTGCTPAASAAGSMATFDLPTLSVLWIALGVMTARRRRA
jgi:hypothetical protein